MDVANNQLLKKAALTYAVVYGWPVFPVIPNGKKPATASGFKEATRDPAIIAQWWDNNSEFNIGISTGTVNDGIFVIDLDENREKGVSGINTLREYESTRCALPATIMSQTPRGGRHIFFRSDSEVKCKTGIFPGVDIRGSGGYIIAPPSVVNGKAYRWINAPGTLPVAEADSNVFTFINPVPDSFDKGPFTMPEVIPEGKRTTTLLQLLGSLQSKGLSDDSIRAAVCAENDTRCDPPLSDDELEREIFPALKRFAKNTAPYAFDRPYTTETAELMSQLTELHPEQNKRYGWHDAGNSNLFSDLFSDVACYVPERKKWYVFDGSRWVPDVGNMKVMELCKIAADALMSYTIQCVNDEKLRADYIKHISKWQQYKYRTTILQDAASVVPTKLYEFDRNPYFLNCLNGTLNLRDMSFHEHSPADKLTKICGAEYHPEARCERWDQFIIEVTCGDTELAAFIQKALGYALTGDTRYECFFILYGATSRNGKSTLCEVLMQLTGEYGRTASPETIAQRKYSDSRSPTEDIARLAGARFVNMSEPDKQLSLSASLVKTLTGNDTVSARFLGENSFEFKPQFKIFINTNHLPYVSDSTLFSSDRVKIIPFARHFEAWERDSGLKGKLTAPESLSGILNWCIAGLQALRLEGFKMPDAVKTATQQYMENSDKIGQFVDSELECIPAAEVETKAVHTIYQDWCFKNGYRPEGLGEFKKSLASAGIEVKRKRPESEKSNPNANKVSFILGYRLKTH